MTGSGEKTKAAVKRPAAPGLEVLNLEKSQFCFNKCRFRLDRAGSFPEVCSDRDRAVYFAKGADEGGAIMAHFQGRAEKEVIGKIINEHGMVLLAFNPGPALRIGRGSEEFTLSAFRQCIRYLPEGTYQLYGEGLLDAYLLGVPLDKTRELLPEGHPLEATLQNAVSGSLPEGGFGPLTSGMQTILYETKKHLARPVPHTLFLRAKLYELLFLQLEVECSVCEGADGVKDGDRQKVILAMQIMTQDLDRLPSLRTLAREVGTNEYHLKKHFKEVFGTTVFGYLNTFKMEKAKEMIVDGNEPIGEIARQLGYRHATHFSAAFKKHFGYLPRQIRNTGN